MIRKAYFPILNPLRFLASLCVLLTHSVVFFNGRPAFSWQSGFFFAHAGYFGVLFFYVLSGFLITYLLLVEKETTGGIDTRQFYRRRILRIWPLYYLIVVLSFFILPYLWPWKQSFHGVDHGMRQLLLYALFLPNLIGFAGGWFFMPSCFQTYTIGYEEQFYLFWPWVMRMARKFLFSFLAIIFFGNILLEMARTYFLRPAGVGQGGITHLIKGCLIFVTNWQLPAFVAGAVAGCIYLHGSPGLLKVLKGKLWTYVLPMVILLLMCFADIGVTGFVNLVSLVFAWLILNLILRGATMGKLQPLLSKGGDISYGVYIFHPMVFIFVRAFKIGMPNEGIAYALYLAGSMLLIFGLSFLSYRYFETPFLRRKYAGGQDDKVR